MTPLTAHLTPEHVASRGHRVGIARRCHLEIAPGPGTPMLQAAGRFLAPAGRYFPGLLGGPVAESDLISYALAEIGRGAAWVKVIADFPDLAAGTDAEATYQLGAIADLVAAVHAAGVRVAVHSTRGRTPRTSSPARPPSWPAGSGCAKRIRRRSLLYAFADTSWWRLLNDLLDVVDDG
jgi:hypothetical protein